MAKEKPLINFKGSEELKEAIRVVAFNQGHSNNSKVIVAALESNELICKELKKVKQRIKNKVA